MPPARHCFIILILWEIHLSDTVEYFYDTGSIRAIQREPALVKHPENPLILKILILTKRSVSESGFSGFQNRQDTVHYSPLILEIL